MGLKGEIWITRLRIHGLGFTGFREGVEKLGWASRKDGLFAEKFKGDADPKEGLHPSNCRNHRERMVLEFLMPILNPEKPKRITLNMANTLFGAMSGVRSVNWGLLIHEVVGKVIPHVGRKPSFISPFILHLYQHFHCITTDEEDMLTITSEGGPVSGTLGSRMPHAEGGRDSEEKIAPSPNMRRMVTRLQKASPGGGSSAVSLPDSHSKEGAAPKKPRSS